MSLRNVGDRARCHMVQKSSQKISINTELRGKIKISREQTSLSGIEALTFSLAHFSDLDTPPRFLISLHQQKLSILFP